MSKKQMGFTLIEIVMVLVLLGILSAIAVPKYFDLRAQAEQKAMAATVAEYQARLNAGFANSLLNDNNCTTARSAGIDEANLMPGVSTDGAAPGDSDSFSFGIKKLENNIDTATTKLTLKGKNATTGTEFDIAIPQCN